MAFFDSNRTLKIATRKSPLAMWQAEFIKQQLTIHYTWLKIEFLPIVTQGDVILDSSLSKIGGKGLFVKQLETALLNHEADLAVHSIKDIPYYFPNDLFLSTVCQRDEKRDAFVSNSFATLSDLPKGAIIGTSSLRRQTQIKMHYPHLKLANLRGNVGTRLDKLDAGEYDAIILAAAGLNRLDMSERIRKLIDVKTMLPAVGQGAIGIEIRESDSELKQLLSVLNHKQTEIEIKTERAMNSELKGGCQVPIGCFTQIKNETIELTGWVGSLDGSQSITVTQTGSLEQPEILGKSVGDELLNCGADKILAAIQS